MAKNIGRFNYYVGAVFAQLYQAFPVKIQVDMPAIIGCTESDETYASGFWTGRYLSTERGIVEDFTEEFECLRATMLWLHETGYLLGRVGATSGGFEGVVTLSPKALELLKVIPAALADEAESRSFGDALIDAVNGAAVDKVGELAGDALSYLYKFGMESVTNLAG
ncbi:hypothetical protein [Aliamphritea spongicola]|uniref:hypothetical protein n=1 Tax=Aliamphritea spongicola TaxID=707589 RepID=UPI00196A368D|nr:hypothetical protein [Aliamphritea spongicola]MBN3561233.1 hypothetical protein [Aliamphritea spongicola]